MCVDSQEMGRSEPDSVSEPPRSTFISSPAHTRSTARQHWQHPAAPKGTLRLCVPVAMIFKITPTRLEAAQAVILYYYCLFLM